MKSSVRFLPYRSLLLVAIALVMLLGNRLWLSSVSRAQAEETTHEVEATPEAVVFVRARRQDRSPSMLDCSRTDRCRRPSSLAKHLPATPSPGHRLSHEMLAPLIC